MDTSKKLGLKLLKANLKSVFWNIETHAKKEKFKLEIVFFLTRKKKFFNNSGSNLSKNCVREECLLKKVGRLNFCWKVNTQF